MNHSGHPSSSLTLRRRAAAMLVALMTVGACSSGPATQAPTTAATPPAGATQTPGTPATSEPTSGNGPWSPPDIALPPPEQDSINVGVTALEANTFTIKYAQDVGLYEKYGLDATFYNFPGEPAGVGAMVAGQVDCLHAASQGVFISQKTSAPIVAVGVGYNKFLDYIFSAPGVTTADDLRGKRIAVSTLGGQSHQEVLVALQVLGLTADDVVITQIGGQSARIAAMQAGSVEAIPADSALAPQLTSEGFEVLVKLPEVSVEVANGVLECTKEFIDANPNTVLAFVAANMAAGVAKLHDPDAAIPYFAAFAQLSPEEAKPLLDSFLAVAQHDLEFTDQGFENVKSFIELQDPSIADVDVTSVYDHSFLDQLKSLGFQAALGLPGY